MAAERIIAMIAGRGLRLYVAGAAVWLGAYVFAPAAVGPVLFLVAAVAAIPCVAYGLSSVRPGKRAPWWLLLAALATLSSGLSVRMVERGGEPLGVLLNAAGNVLIFVAAVAMILRCAHTDIGGVIDATILGLALGGVLCIGAFGLSSVESDVARVNLFVVLFALSGVLGALVRIAMILTQPVAALRWLMLGLALALVANVVQVLSTAPVAARAAGALFMAAYLSVGAFGLHPTAPRLVRPGFVKRDDALTLGRLLFLGAAVAVVPIVVGALTLLARATRRDGAVLLADAAAMAVLVMVRIGRLAADRARAEQVLRQQATVDQLTGLPNRRSFVEHVATAVERERCAVLFCDLDGFKQVNDKWGHGVGDELLAQVGGRLAASVRDTDLVSRFGGDEFVVLIVGADRIDLDAIVGRIRAGLTAPFELSSGPLTLGASIGVAETVPGDDAEDMVQAADTLMYEAKRRQEHTPTVRVAT